MATERLKKYLCSVLAAVMLIITPGAAGNTRVFAEQAVNEQEYQISTDTLVMTSTNSDISFVWKKTKADAYIVYVKNIYSGKYEEFETVTEPRFTVYDLLPEKLYSFRIVPVTLRNGEYVRHKSQTFKYRTKKLPAPTGITASSSRDSVTLSWDKQDEAVKYGIFIYNDDNGKYDFLSYTKKNTYTVKELDENRKYTFKIFSVTSGVKFQTLSAPFSVLTKGDPADIEDVKGKLSKKLYSSLKKLGDDDDISVYIYIKCPDYSEENIELMIYSDTGATRDVNYYNSIRLRYIEAYFSSITDSFRDKYIKGEVKVTYKSNFTPVICLEATKEEILRLAAAPETASMDIFKNDIVHND